MSGDEDMALTPISGTVELSFDTRNGGAWDDRELIKASEAAMQEFHVHHPGPGSWLDKATAALAAGHKLPGADDYGTSWYSASLPQPGADKGASSSSAPAQAQSNTQAVNKNRNQDSNKRRRIKKTNGNIPNIDGNMTNPYAPSTSTSTKRDRRSSPKYQPGSPGDRPIDLPIDLGPLDTSDEEDDEYEYENNKNDNDDSSEAEEEEEEEEEEEYDDDAEWDLHDYSRTRNRNPDQGYSQNHNTGNGGYSQGNGYDQLFPSLGVYPPGGINREEALGYAITAQYWAGYWMGVAQSSSSSASTSSPRSAVQPQPQSQIPVQQQNHIDGSRQHGQADKRSRRKRRQVDFANGHMNGEAEAQGDRNLIGPTIPSMNGGDGHAAGSASNIRITRKRFDRPPIELRR
ncbi:uncharacterized protein I303_101372 [Kwoniella dejecticola CBS 10117]|uniref:Uncharacterized protein n=1 Tax=Kwoniella dejecticola CBS 10117 TaxID=1296121 RepID=A0A1A6AHR2_9TREE|nr:uncharacterized protein I303_01381 [Kwoniella dejecticola CBS 10117]OBR89553.1 hypothetical protein I303_01381 [Kwoniella dejecticola CBS 10117]